MSLLEYKPYKVRKKLFLIPVLSLVSGTVKQTLNIDLKNEASYPSAHHKASESRSKG